MVERDLAKVDVAGPTPVSRLWQQKIKLEGHSIKREKLKDIARAAARRNVKPKNLFIAAAAVNITGILIREFLKYKIKKEELFIKKEKRADYAPVAVKFSVKDTLILSAVPVWKSNIPIKGFLIYLIYFILSRRGGMADAVDSKSSVFTIF